MRELVDHIEGINRLMARYGVKFGIYKNGEFGKTNLFFTSDVIKYFRKNSNPTNKYFIYTQTIR